MSTRILLKTKQIAIFLLIALLLAFSAAAGASQLEVHFIDVGQGDSILVLTPDGQSMLVDSGGNDAGPTVVRYLQAAGVKKIDVLVGTHPHADHIGGMQEVLASFKVAQVYDSGRIHTSKTFEEYLKTIDAKKIPFALARAGDKIPLGTKVSLTVLSPDGPRKTLNYRDLNESSVVLFLQYGQVGFLLTGDAGKESESTMLAAGLVKEAEVLKIGHHGSRSSTSSEFLRKVAPKAAVLMCGAKNPYGHPHKEVMERLEGAELNILRTDQQGSIVFTSDGEGFTYKASQTSGTNQGGTGVPVQPQDDGRIDINIAPAAQLETLPGIGETLAQRIIEYRIKVGPFTTPEDLLEVKGIGEATLAKIRNLITF